MHDHDHAGDHCHKQARSTAPRWATLTTQRTLS